MAGKSSAVFSEAAGRSSVTMYKPNPQTLHRVRSQNAELSSGLLRYDCHTPGNKRGSAALPRQDPTRLFHVNQYGVFLQVAAAGMTGRVHCGYSSTRTVHINTCSFLQPDQIKLPGRGDQFHMVMVHDRSLAMTEDLIPHHSVCTHSPNIGPATGAPYTLVDSIDFIMTRHALAVAANDS